MRTVDLTIYIPTGTGILRDRVLASKLRDICQLDTEDTIPDSLRIIFPSTVFTATSAFCIELFGKSVKYLGAAQFKSKYNISCSSTMRPMLRACITHILSAKEVE